MCLCVNGTRICVHYHVQNRATAHECRFIFSSYMHTLMYLCILMRGTDCYKAPDILPMLRASQQSTSTPLASSKSVFYAPCPSSISNLPCSTYSYNRSDATCTCSLSMNIEQRMDYVNVRMLRACVYSEIWRK